MNAKQKEFSAYLLKQIGHTYVWGGQGENLNAMDDPEAWIRKRENSAKNVQRSINAYNKLKATGKDPIIAYDCSGLAVRWLLDNKLIKRDMTSDNLRKQCDEITRAQVVPGDWCFRVNGSKAYHIGYVVDGMKVVEAKGREAGVVINDIDAVRGYWTNYGRPSKIFGIPDDAYDEWTVDRVLKLVSPLMRGDDVKELQQRLYGEGFRKVLVDGDIKTLTTDGAFGKITESAVKAFQKSERLTVDGKAGKNTITALGGVWKG